MEETTSSGTSDTTGPNDAPGDPKETGAALLKQGQFSEAAAALREAVRADPDDGSAWALLGGALASNGENEEAVMAFERAAALTPALARSHYNLALAYENVGRLADAKARLEK